MPHAALPHASAAAQAAGVAAAAAFLDIAAQAGCAQPRTLVRSASAVPRQTQRTTSMNQCEASAPPEGTCRAVPRACTAPTVAASTLCQELRNPAGSGEVFPTNFRRCTRPLSRVFCSVCPSTAKLAGCKRGGRCYRQAPPPRSPTRRSRRSAHWRLLLMAAPRLRRLSRSPGLQPQKAWRRRCTRRSTASNPGLRPRGARRLAQAPRCGCQVANDSSFR